MVAAAGFRPGENIISGKNREEGQRGKDNTPRHASRGGALRPSAQEKKKSQHISSGPGHAEETRGEEHDGRGGEGEEEK
jgi:hypothetical protein